MSNFLVKSSAVLILILLEVVSSEEEFDFSKCGRNKKLDHLNPEYLSIGSYMAESGEYPWLASYGLMENGVWKHFCGGTIISDTQILTAFHCFRELDMYTKLRFQIRVGDVDLTSAIADDNNVQVRDVICGTVHPNRVFNGTALYYDVVVLHLNDSLTYTKYVRPICLPAASNMTYNDRASIIIGWGEGQEPLRKANIQIYSESFCNKTYSSSNLYLDRTSSAKASIAVPDLFNSSVLCAGFVGGGFGTCPGDSGGPLVVFETSLEEPKFIQVGVVCGGIKCDEYPGVYANLADDSILSFVTKIISKKQYFEDMVKLWRNEEQLPTRTCPINAPPEQTTSAPSSEQTAPSKNATGPGFTKILVATGNTATGITNDIEIIDLDSSETNCGRLKMFPSFVSSPMGGLNFNNQPIICGGYDFFDENNKNCFAYYDGEWRATQPLIEPRSYSPIIPSPFPNDRLGLFVTGGIFENKAHKTSEVLTPNGWELLVPHLPVSVSHHCMVQLNSSRVFVIGGSQDNNTIPYSARTYILDTDNLIWKEGPPLNQGRKHHGCAKVWKDSYSLKYSIVVVGGENKDFIPTVEVLDEDGSTWRQGPSLPFGISRSVLLEDPRGGVVLIGGRSEEESYLRTLYRLPHAGKDAEWEEMFQRLKTGRFWHTAFLVPNNVSKCIYYY